MMHPGVVVSGLLLLLIGAVDSYRGVSGVVGHPVTLPCTYDVSRIIANMCWGRGQCPYSKCSGQLIWTNGHHVTYQRNSRFQLKGNIPEGNVSLTIENAAQGDSGLYCCRVEMPGLFNDQLTTLELQVRPEIPSPLTRPTTTTKSGTTTRPTTTTASMTTRPTTTSRPRTTTQSTQTPMSTSVSTSTPPIPAHTQTPEPAPTTPSLPQTTITQPTEKGTSMPSYTPTDYNDTVTSSNEPSNHTEAISTQEPQVTGTKGFVAGISIAVLVLLILATAMAVAKYIQMKRRMRSLRSVSFRVSKMGALENAAQQQRRAEDNIYIIEDNIYDME